MSKKIIAFGEMLLRLSTVGHQRFGQARQLEVNYGGSEANVLIALSNHGLEGAMVSKVPDNAIGQAAINELRKYGMDTRFISRGGKRMGLYFLEPGASVRSSQVIYDRADSAISRAETADFDIDAILDQADWFHTTGISPALSNTCANLTEQFLKRAKEKGIPTSLDLNYRSKLWNKERARKRLYALSKYVDLCIGIDIFAEEMMKEDNLLFSGRGKATLLTDEEFKKVFSKMQDRLDFKCIASTRRKILNASENEISAVLYDGRKLYRSEKYRVQIVDRVGGGDAFASGVVYGLLKDWKMNRTIDFAMASSVIKHTIPGDFNLVTLAEINKLINGKDSGKLQR